MCGLPLGRCVCRMPTMRACLLRPYHCRQAFSIGVVSIMGALEGCFEFALFTHGRFIHTTFTPGNNITFTDNSSNPVQITSSAPDMTNPVWFMVGCVMLATVLILFFNSNYKRLEVRFTFSACLFCLLSDELLFSLLTSNAVRHALPSGRILCG